MLSQKGLALPRASHSREIALAGSRRLRFTLVALPVLFAHARTPLLNSVVEISIVVRVVASMCAFVCL